MNKHRAEGSIGGVEDIIAELHERGVKTGQEESERILAAARLQSGEILKEAEAERERILAEGKREAERIQEAAGVEARQMLETFMASLPEIFARRASRLLDGILDNTFDVSRHSNTVADFVSFLDGEKEQRIKAFFATADPQSFLEGLLVLAVAFYAGADGFDRFTLDNGLRSAWARLMADPGFDPAISYEFRDGINGFRVSGRDEREIVVSPECIRHMAQVWAGEEFREVFMALLSEKKEAGS